MAYTGSASDRLTAVQAAIAKCLNSQEYYVGGRRQRMAELKDLRALEKDLLNEIASASGGDSMATLAIVVRGDR